MCDFKIHWNVQFRNVLFPYLYGSSTVFLHPRLNVDLHCGDYRSKLILEADKNNFYVEESPSLERFCLCKYHLTQTFTIMVRLHLRFSHAILH